MPRRQILSLSGGGYAGLFSAKFLALLEEQLTAPSMIGERFDAFAGTSVGGLIVLALASGQSAQTVLKTMRTVGSKVFPQKRGGMLRAVFGPKRAAEPLRAQLGTLLQNGKFGDLPRPCVITAVVWSAKTRSCTGGRKEVFVMQSAKDCTGADGI
jgi:patatin-like phospholipase/acyl hydrolase